MTHQDKKHVGYSVKVAVSELSPSCSICTSKYLSHGNAKGLQIPASLKASAYWQLQLFVGAIEIVGPKGSVDGIYWCAVARG